MRTTPSRAATTRNQVVALFSRRAETRYPPSARRSRNEASCQRQGMAGKTRSHLGVASPGRRAPTLQEHFLHGLCSQEIAFQRERTVGEARIAAPRLVAVTERKLLFSPARACLPDWPGLVGVQVVLADGFSEAIRRLIAGNGLSGVHTPCQVPRPFAERTGIGIALEEISDVFGLGLFQRPGGSLQRLTLLDREPDGQGGGGYGEKLPVVLRQARQNALSAQFLCLTAFVLPGSFST